MIPDMVRGDETGVAFPSTIESLTKQGPEFLTRAFRAVGTLSADNRVTAIARAEEFIGGGMGRKLLLDLEYARDEDLGRELFVKFPLDEGHPQRADFTWPMQAEARLYLLSLRCPLPVAVPRTYFADFNQEQMCGIVITERVAYGQNGIEPRIDKCEDYLLDNQYERYRAVARANAALAGAFRVGSTETGVGKIFPFPGLHQVSGERLPYSQTEIDQRIAKLREYAKNAPQLLPKNFASEDFLDRFEHEARLVLENQDRIFGHLNSATEFIGLSHWNINIDNAWFWRDDRAELKVGFLDWGSAQQMNIARGFWGMICAAEIELIDAHRTDLMSAAVESYREAGGPAITPEGFEFMYRLTAAVDAFYWMINAPIIVEMHLPNYAEMADRHDPRLHNTFLARAQSHILTVMLNEFSWANVKDAIARLDAE